MLCGSISFGGGEKMKLYSIKDNYLFKTDQKDGAHTYTVWYDRRKKAYLAVQTTHLYKLDTKRGKQIESGHLIRQKLPGITLPSGVRDFAYMTDVDGHKISIKNSNVKEISKKHLPKKISDEIKAHACGCYMVKKKNSRR
jgi:hypothetical protein